MIKAGFWNRYQEHSEVRRELEGAGDATCNHRPCVNCNNQIKVLQDRVEAIKGHVEDRLEDMANAIQEQVEVVLGQVGVVQALLTPVTGNGLGNGLGNDVSVPVSVPVSVSATVVSAVSGDKERNKRNQAAWRARQKAIQGDK